MIYDKRCPYGVILKDFDWRIKLCKLQNWEPTFCPEVKEDCPVYSREYNSDTSVRHSFKNDDIVRPTLKMKVQNYRIKSL